MGTPRLAARATKWCMLGLARKPPVGGSTPEAPLDVIGQAVEVGVVGTSLQEQDIAVSVLAEASREDGSGGARADNDGVVSHALLRRWAGPKRLQASEPRIESVAHPVAHQIERDYQH